MESVLAPIKAGWELFKKHVFFIWIVLGIIWGISLFFGMVQSQFPKDSAADSLISLISFAVLFFLQLGSIRLFLHLVRTGEELPIEELFSEKAIFGVAFLGAILYYLLAAVGFIFLIIPGVYVLIRFFFLSYVFVDQKLKLKEAFAETSRLTAGHRWQLVGFVLVLVLLNVLGALALIIGLVVTVPVTTLATVYAYESLRKAKSTEEIPVAVEVEEAPAIAL